MSFRLYHPSRQLRPYIRHFAVSEQSVVNEYKVFPSTGLVLGFQFKGALISINGATERRLDAAGITGISGSYKVFRNTADTGTVLVYFTETGFAQFVRLPVHKLFDLSIALEEVFDKHSIADVLERLALAPDDARRILTVEQFLLKQLREDRQDQLVTAAVDLIHRSGGTIRVGALQAQLFISQSPLEKRFRSIVGTSSKRFASIVRFNAALRQLERGDISQTGIAYKYGFFDQAHFIHDFRQYTGVSPDAFRRSK